MKKYQYKVEIVKTGMIFDSNKKQEAQLNELGAQGWQLIAQIQSKKYMKYVFIREV